MKYLPLRALSVALLLPCLAAAQETPPAPSPQETPVPAPSPTPEQAATTPKGEIRLNFQNASLVDVLNYLSETIGFVIIQETPVTGTINIVSRQSINADEAVDLLNAVLAEKGYTAIRNNRILKIISRNNAQKNDIPVKTGSDPEKIPRKDGMVTQILPVRYVDAAKLVENLRPLLSNEATISANEASNSILLADTQTHIHRIAEIIHALDTSVSSISSVRVFQLQFADSKSLAAVLTQLFSSDQSSKGSTNNQQQGNGRNRGGGGFPGMPGMPGMPGAATAAATPDTAQQTATRVITVADEQSNSVIACAPEGLMSSIADIINRVDTNIADVTETRIFRLQFADATELATILTTLYSDTGTTTKANKQTNNGFPFPMQQQATTTTTQSSARALLQTRVVAVPDPRTNSILVSAARDTMTQIASTVTRLDANETKKQHVYIHRLENADPDNVATILKSMYSSQSTSSSSSLQPSAARLSQRTTNGASSDVTDTLNSSN